MTGYCAVALGHPVHGPYHDTEYGFALDGEAALFERLCLEIFQAGLSWLLVLKKRPTLFAAFDGFDLDKVAAYGEADIDRLLADPGIIRNRLKVLAIIENARRIAALRQSHGGFKSWLDAHHPLAKDDWVQLFRKNFKFTGGEVVNEFLMSTGYLPGAHHVDCPIFNQAVAAAPPWLKK